MTQLKAFTGENAKLLNVHELCSECWMNGVGKLRSKEELCNGEPS